MNPEIKALVDAVVVAAEDDATEEAKRRGAIACKSLGALFGAEPGEPLVVAAVKTAPVAQAAGELRAVEPTVLLDALIAKLRSFLPDDDEPDQPDGAALKVPFVPLPTERSQ